MYHKRDEPLSLKPVSCIMSSIDLESSACAPMYAPSGLCSRRRQLQLQIEPGGIPHWPRTPNEISTLLVDCHFVRWVHHFRCHRDAISHSTLKRMARSEPSSVPPLAADTALQLEHSRKHLVLSSSATEACAIAATTANLVRGARKLIAIQVPGNHRYLWRPRSGVEPMN